MLEPAVTFKRTAVSGVVMATALVLTSALPNELNHTALLELKVLEPVKSKVPSMLKVALEPVMATLALKGRMAVSGNHVGNPAVELRPVILATNLPLGIDKHSLKSS